MRYILLLRLLRLFLYIFLLLCHSELHVGVDKSVISTEPGNSPSHLVDRPLAIFQRLCTMDSSY